MNDTEESREIAAPERQHLEDIVAVQRVCGTGNPDAIQWALENVTVVYMVQAEFPVSVWTDMLSRPTTLAVAQDVARAIKATPVRVVERTITITDRLAPQ